MNKSSTFRIISYLATILLLAGLYWSFHPRERNDQKLLTASPAKPVTAIKEARILTYKGVEYYVYTANTQQTPLGLYYDDAQGTPLGTIQNLRSHLQSQSKRLIFATNGGIFRPDGRPEGLFIENQRTRFPMNLRKGSGNFYLKPNGVFYINKYGFPHVLDSQTFYNKLIREQPGQVKFAIQSGPMLIQSARINKNFKPNSINRFIRSGVGAFEAQRGKETLSIFALSRSPVNFYDFASFFKDVLGCNRALYLDGSISEMYLPALNLNYTQNRFAVMIGITQN